MLNKKADAEAQPRAKFNGLLVIVCNKWTFERSVHCLWNEWKWLFNYASAVEVVCSQAPFKADVGKIKMRVFILGALGFGWNCLAIRQSLFWWFQQRGLDLLLLSPPHRWALCSCPSPVRNGPSKPLQLHKLHSSWPAACGDFEEGQLDILPVANSNSSWIQARCPDLPLTSHCPPLQCQNWLLWICLLLNAHKIFWQCN